MKKRAIVWFRNDLRIHDNESLIKAAEYDEVIFLYCFDPIYFGHTEHGFPKTGPHRGRFLLESLEDLQNRLQELGNNLVIRRGDPSEVIPELVTQYSVSKVFAQEEVTREEIVTEDELISKLDNKIEFHWGHTLFHIEDVPFDEDKIPDVFTSFRKKCEKYSEVRAEYEEKLTPPPVKDIDTGKLPSLSDLEIEEKPQDERSVLSFEGGETAALARLNDYIWTKDLLKKYKNTRNGLLGADYSSKFSPWLANGCLSPRRIYHEVKKYEEERTSNKSTYWMIFELIWRDYFRYSALKYGDKIFHAGGIQGKKRDWKGKNEAFQKWAGAATGIPFIDANMRELNKTGFMSNRGRQNVASFLAQNLNIDWRIGAEYFESLLLDYDPCSNYGNWAYNATVGHDPRNRYFNIINQADRYDKKAEYIKHWLPELKNVPPEKAHEPWKLTDAEQSEYGIQIGHDYPQPMIDLEKSYEEIRKRD
ncbi:DASH family cryptochrome [Balneola sp. MJW-20]|uniref:DASH family cryptochrome n=1 Tax=Gracilimonas aurantiaca TaxID=3234185 RepID=UPI003467CD2C